MEGQFFSYLYQYHLYKTWEKEQVERIKRTLSEEFLFKSSYTPPESIWLNALIDDWNYNFNQFIELYNKCDLLQKLELGWLAGKANINEPKIVFYLYIKEEIVEEIEKQFPNLKERREKFEDNKNNCIKEIEKFKKRLEWIVYYLFNFSDGGLLFSKYNFYMKLVTLSIFNELKDFDDYFLSKYNNIVQSLDSKIIDINISEDRRNNFSKFLQFVQDIYKDILCQRNSFFNLETNELNIPDYLTGFPALVLKLRHAKKSKAEIAKVIDSINKPDEKDELEKITNPMLGVLLSENTAVSSWKRIGLDARKEYKKKNKKKDKEEEMN